MARRYRSGGSGAGEVAGGCLAFIVIAAINLAWIALVVAVIVWVLQSMGVL